MLPFPLNYAYPSTPVVSDELASEVYLRVVESGKSVRMVSAELNISLDRVAAIVRLKTIEKRWEKEVGLHICILFTNLKYLEGRNLCDESPEKYSISLEDTYMVISIVLSLRQRAEPHSHIPNLHGGNCVLTHNFLR